ncbi:hypothetical protein V6W11_12480 [Micromonospora profundi]|uniref:hypothetical protein n=1 Tax=Micromonospora profundi TaxID=1420889 RepID=UPI002FF38E25
METRLESFEVLSLLDPVNRLGPNWTRLPATAVIVRPTLDEADAFNRLLARRFPYGTSQIALIRAILGQGHEVFVTGGTVRDIITGVEPYDLDVVTSMPLARLEAIGRGLCPSWPQLTETMRLNGRHTVGDPPPGVTLDIAVFKRAWPGSPSAVFGADMAIDSSYRDFSINALYFDPVNEILFDPSGFGLLDASERVLRCICEKERRTDRQQAKLCIRAIRFYVEGFRPDELSLATVSRLLSDGTLGAMRTEELLAFFRSQLLDRDPGKRQERFDAARTAFEVFQATKEWERYFASEEEELLS